MRARLEENQRRILEKLDAEERRARLAERAARESAESWPHPEAPGAQPDDASVRAPPGDAAPAG
jgi:hypothetical protein